MWVESVGALRRRFADKRAVGRASIDVVVDPQILIVLLHLDANVVGRVALVGDAAGTVTKSSGEGIYFAAKSARMCAETLVEVTNGGQRIPTENDLKLYIKRWDKQYGMTYLVLDLLQRVFYRTDATREAFVEMCADKDVQRLTFDSYLYKTVVPANPLIQMKITAKTIGSLLRGNALAP